MYSEIMWTTARERWADLLRSAAAERVARDARRIDHPAGRPADDTRLTLRLDRVWDSSRLHELAAAAGRRLPQGPFVVTEIRGRVVAALPLAGGPPLADPGAATAHLLPLLELRAEQIRRVTVGRPRRRRLLLRRA